MFVAAYLAIEWLTFTDRLSPLGSAPWNPAIGLSCALLIVKGLRFAPVFFVAVLLAQFFPRNLPFDASVFLLEAAIPTATYVLAMYALPRLWSEFDPRLQRASDVVALLFAGASGALVASLAYVIVLAVSGVLTPTDFATQLLRHAIGDMIGFIVVTPSVLLFLSRPMERPVAFWGLDVGLLLLTIALVLGPFAHVPERKFYLLLLPVIWIAMRAGLAGALRALLVIQVALMVGLHFGRIELDQVGAYQAIMLTLSIAGVMVGAVEDEKSAAGSRLRLLQESLDQATRFAGTAQLASAIAHEVNQPLTAAGNYCRAGMIALEQSGEPVPFATRSIRSAIEQIDRSADVLRSIREFVQAGRLNRAPVDMSEILKDVVELLSSRLGQSKVSLIVKVADPLPNCLVDRQTLQVVMLNIIRNAMEALEAGPLEGRRIEVSIQVPDVAALEVVVSDNGGGFGALSDTGFEWPVRSTKKGGLGIGLSLSRSIVVAHGGTFSIGSALDGAKVSFTLPIFPDQANV